MTKRNKKILWKKTDIKLVDFSQRTTENDLTLVNAPTRIISGCVPVKKFIEMSTPILHEHADVKALIGEYAMRMIGDSAELSDLARFMNDRVIRMPYSDGLKSLLADEHKLAKAVVESSYFHVIEPFTHSNASSEYKIVKNACFNC